MTVHPYTYSVMKPQAQKEVYIRETYKPARVLYRQFVSKFIDAVNSSSNFGEDRVIHILKGIVFESVSKTNYADALREIENELNVESLWGMLISKSRHRAICDIRHVVSYALHRALHFSQYRIGQILGGRDHSSILHGAKTAENLREMDNDKQFTILFDAIIKEVNNRLILSSNKCDDVLVKYRPEIINAINLKSNITLLGLINSLMYYDLFYNHNVKQNLLRQVGLAHSEQHKAFYKKWAEVRIGLGIEIFEPK